MEEHLTIEKMSYGTSAIAHASSGKAVFVEAGAPGDIVTVTIDKEKTRYLEAHINEIITDSPHRITPPCPYYALCGGCPWQHLDYQCQLEAKRANVVSALIHNAGFNKQEAEEKVEDCHPSKRELGYRNKIELNAAYTKKSQFLLGYRESSSMALFTPDECRIAHKKISHSPKALRGALRYLQGQKDLGIFRVGLRQSLRTGSLEIALWTKPGYFPRAIAAQTLSSSINATSIVRVIADPGKARKIKQVEALYGPGCWEEKLAGFSYKISAPSFFQVNTGQAECLIDAVISGLKIDKGSVVADLYAGAGTFSLALSRKADVVFAVESASSSVGDLRRNAELNSCDVEIIGGDSERELPSLGPLDALVLDPPRSGLSEGIIESISCVKPEQIAYVSCNPATWSRDVARLKAKGFILERAQPVDLFPQSYHVEIVSFFHQ